MRIVALSTLLLVGALVAPVAADTMGLPGEAIELAPGAAACDRDVHVETAVGTVCADYPIQA